MAILTRINAALDLLRVRNAINVLAPGAKVRALDLNSNEHKQEKSNTKITNLVEVHKRNDDHRDQKRHGNHQHDALAGQVFCTKVDVRQEDDARHKTCKK